jgi:hypothetical protein
MVSSVYKVFAKVAADETSTSRYEHTVPLDSRFGLDDRPLGTLDRLQGMRYL